MVPEPELIVCLIRGKMKHAGLKGNDQPDRLAGKKSGLHLGKYAVLRSLRPYLWAQSRGHHTIDRLEERGVERGSARRSSFERTREGHRQSDEHWSWDGGAHTYGLFPIDYSFNWTEGKVFLDRKCRRQDGNCLVRLLQHFRYRLIPSRSR